ncbi:glycosyltransferase family 4 protein [Cobetia amphilecti]|nr:glycosyltransferase family 4 protein [Cobetia litoralis]
MKIIHIQPALPKYRINFFEQLYSYYGKNLDVYYTKGSLGILTRCNEENWAIPVGNIKSFLNIILWQKGVVKIPINRDDIIVLSGNPRYISTLYLFCKAKINGAKVIWWGHYWSSTSRKWRLWLRHLPMLLSDGLLFYTEEEVNRFISSHNLSSKKTTLGLNNGVDITDIKKLRLAYNAKYRDDALLFVGRLTDKSNLSLAFQAIAILKDRAPVLHIIGDGINKKILSDLAFELNISDKVIWHGAITEESKIAEIANKCKGFLYPGDVGLSLIHAMAYGLPCIVHNTRKKHMPEIAAFIQGETGLSFDINSCSSLSSTIIEFVSDDNKLNTFSKNSLNIVGPSFTTEDMAVRFIELIDRMKEKR